MVIKVWIDNIEKSINRDGAELAIARTSLAESLVGLERHDDARTQIEDALDTEGIEDLQRASQSGLDRENLSAPAFGACRDHAGQVSRW